jgi:hypothetical protein
LSAALDAIDFFKDVLQMFKRLMPPFGGEMSCCAQSKSVSFRSKIPRANRALTEFLRVQIKFP